MFPLNPWDVHMSEYNQSLNPVSAQARVLDFFDFLSLWGSLGVGLLVMLAGASLLPALSLAQALGAIFVGSVLGAALLGWVGRLGAVTGLSSAGLIWPSLGKGFARVPVVLNILQLIGWALFEIIVMRDGLNAVLSAAGVQVPVVFLTALVGMLLAILLALAMTGFVRKFIRGIGVSLTVAALAWISLQLARQGGFGEVWNKPGDGSMSFAAAVDLVIAMPISWLPLVADYTRFGKSPGRAYAGTSLGYGLANGWCFALGVLLVALFPGKDTLAAILLLPVGGLALGLILLDEMDNGYSDLYSASVSGHSMMPRLSVRQIGPVLALLGALAAILLPIGNFADFQSKYQDFLYLIGAVFVPLFAVVIAHFMICGEQSRAVDAPNFVWPGIVGWVAGFVFYEALGGFSSLINIMNAVAGLDKDAGYHVPALLQPMADFGGTWGASIPSLLLAMVVYAGMSRMVPSRAQLVKG